MKKIVPKLLIIASVTYATVMMWHWMIGFTFFTQLSNLYTAAAVLAQLFSSHRAVRVWKYTATVSIAVTGLVFLTVLAPMHPGGMLAAYAQDHFASLCLHVLTPTLTVFDFLVNDTDYPWHARHAVYALLPPLGYFAGVEIMALCGFRWNGMTAPYPFLNWDAPAGWFGYLPETANYRTMGIGVFYAVMAMLLLFVLLGAALLGLVKLFAKEKKAQ